MNFRTFFFLIVIALSSNSYAQWWVDGGNLIWPYGNVTISKGSLHIKDSDTTTSSIWSDTESGIFARGNRSSWWGVIQAEAIGVDGDDPTIPLYGVKGYATPYYSSGELYSGTWGGYFSNNPRLSGTAKTKTNFNFPTNSVTGVTGEIAVNSHTQVDLDITCGVGAYLIAYQMENDITNYLGFGSTGWIAESDSFSVENYFAYYSRPALLLKDIDYYYGYYSDDILAGTVIDTFYHFYGKGDHPSYFGGSVNSAGGYNYSADTSSTDAYKMVLSGAHTLVAGLEVTFIATTANTDGATLTINSLTAKALTKASGGAINTALATGDILAGQVVKAVYDGTQFQVISRLAP